MHALHIEFTEYLLSTAGPACPALGLRAQLSTAPGKKVKKKTNVEEFFSIGLLVLVKWKVIKSLLLQPGFKSQASQILKKLFFPYPAHSWTRLSVDKCVLGRAYRSISCVIGRAYRPQADKRVQ